MNLDQLFQTFELLWKGMLTIFVGIITIYLIILLISNLDNIKNFFTKNKDA